MLESLPIPEVTDLVPACAGADLSLSYVSDGGREELEGNFRRPLRVTCRRRLGHDPAIAAAAARLYDQTQTARPRPRVDLLA